MALSSVLIGSCSEFSPKELVTRILVDDENPVGTPVIERIESYPWHIDTKYYTADIRLCTTEARTIGDEAFAESVQAIVLYFETTQESSFDQVVSWLPFVKEIEPQVRLLVCHRCKESDCVSRHRILTWCLENEFELVELEPVQDSDDEGDDFQETTGIQRVIQALHAHPWPNLVMKDRPNFRSPLLEQMMVEEANRNRTIAENSEDMQVSNSSPEIITDALQPTDAIDTAVNNPTSNLPDIGTLSINDGFIEKSCKDSQNTEKKEMSRSSEGEGACGGTHVTIATSKEDKKKKNEEEKLNKASAGEFPELTNDCATLAALVDGESEADVESFEQLFIKMQQMKEKTQSLPPEQRKAYAEQVAMSFWRAVGGDEDEIGNLSDLDDD